MTAAWSANDVMALGAWHGLNPAMGWLLAVSNAMQARRTSAVFRALPPIACGHLLAIVAPLLPFVLLGLYLERLREVRLASATILVLFGAKLLPEEDLLARLAELPKDKRIIAHCSTGVRAEMAYHKLKDAGYNAGFVYADLDVNKRGEIKLTPKI